MSVVDYRDAYVSALYFGPIAITKLKRHGTPLSSFDFNGIRCLAGFMDEHIQRGWENLDVREGFLRGIGEVIAADASLRDCPEYRMQQRQKLLRRAKAAKEKWAAADRVRWELELEEAAQGQARIEEVAKSQEPWINDRGDTRPDEDLIFISGNPSMCRKVSSPRWKTETEIARDFLRRGVIITTARIPAGRYVLTTNATVACHSSEERDDWAMAGE